MINIEMIDDPTTETEFDEIDKTESLLQSNIETLPQVDKSKVLENSLVLNIFAVWSIYALFIIIGAAMIRTLFKKILELLQCLFVNLGSVFAINLLRRI